VLASCLLGLSLSIKPIGLVLLPILIFHEHIWKKRILLFFIPALIISFQFIPYLWNSNPLESLFTFAKHWTFNGVVFESLNLYFFNNQKNQTHLRSSFGTLSFISLHRQKVALRQIISFYDAAPSFLTHRASLVYCMAFNLSADYTAMVRYSLCRNSEFDQLYYSQL